MSTPSNAPQKSFTAQEVDEWLRAARERRAALHITAADRWNSAQRQEAFADMSELLQQAFEEVRMVSESLREASQGVRSKVADLRAHSTQLKERDTTLKERMAQFVPPPPEEVQQAESQLREMFKDGHRQGKS